MPKVLGLWFIILSGYFWHSVAQRDNTQHERKAILQRIFDLKENRTETSSPLITINVTDDSRNCVKIKCKVVCITGKSNQIEDDIYTVLSGSHLGCHVLEELRLYNYEFPNEIIPRYFLGSFNDRVRSLYVACSNVTDIESGAFGNGIFQKLSFEDLKLSVLRSDFFTGISKDFESLAIIQNDPPLTSIYEGFLDLVQTQIKSLTLQVGITYVKNMTATNTLLSNLAYLDFSNNNFGQNLNQNSFRMLSVVEYLDLSNSQITVLPNYIFSFHVSTLTHLDISNNHIKTISSKIFGWQKRRSDLKVYAHKNNWECDCELQNQMKLIYAYGQQIDQIYCSSPEEYYNWSIYDDKLCEGSVSGVSTAITEGGTNTLLPNEVTINDNGLGGMGIDGDISDQNQLASTTPFPKLPAIDDIELVCRNRTKDLAKILLKIKPALLQFTILTRPNLRVEVIFKRIKYSLEEYGLMWFSESVKELNKVEVDYSENALGCSSTISHLTLLRNLVPNVAYIFCLVHKNHTTISPFNCKSVRTSGNVNVRYAWLTNDHRTTGISLAIFGIVLCTFSGILITFLILKKHPILLKGSKRVSTSKSNQYEIIVLPKDRSLQNMKLKGEMLAKQTSKSNVSQSNQRRESTTSSASYQSYINPNFYEELPSYLSVFSVQDEDNKLYGPTLSKENCSSTWLSYAEIPFRHKRSSNDPLPELPMDEKADVNLTQLGPIGIMRHNFALEKGLAFAYDCVV